MNKVTESEMLAAAKTKSKSTIPIPISPKIDKKIRKLMILLGIDPDCPPVPDWSNG